MFGSSTLESIVPLHTLKDKRAHAACSCSVCVDFIKEVDRVILNAIPEYCKIPIIEPEVRQVLDTSLTGSKG